MRSSNNDLHLHPIAEISDQNAFLLGFVFSSTKMQEESNSRFKTKRFESAQKRKRQEWSYPAGRNEVTLEKNVSFCISFQTN